MNGNGRTRVNGVDGHHRPQNWSVTWDESTTGNNIPGALLAKVIIAILEVGKLAWRFSAILITFQCCKSPLNIGDVSPQRYDYWPRSFTHFILDLQCWELQYF